MTEVAPSVSRKTTFAYTLIPDTAQYKWSDWGVGYKETKKNESLADAKKVAEIDPSINYFFHMKRSMFLEKKDNFPNRSFDSGDAVFFPSESLWLGSAPGMSDTHLIAEQLDMSDAVTKNDIMAMLRKGFLLDKGVDLLDPSVSTANNPKTVTAGWVFVDFQDVAGGDIPSLRDKLEGRKNKISSLETFITRESNGRVKLVVETYVPPAATAATTPATTPGWVRLPGPHTDYESKFLKIAQAVDGLIEFPDHWDIVMFAFPDSDPTPAAPEKDGSAAVYETDGFWIDHSCCITGQLVDEKEGLTQSIQYTFMDPSHYKDKLGADIITIHELMHAFRLPDMYSMDTNRSYGWSMMSAAGAGTHITQFEKLLLGWEDPKNFIFLKRGVVSADVFTKGTKGIIILPDGSREDTYFIEVAQEIGLGEDNKTSFKTANGPDYGLLLFILRKDRAECKIIPFVSKRPTDFLAASLKFGGASEAPFKKADTFSTNGIFSKQVCSQRIIGVNGVYTPSDRASMLRENEKIALGDEVFMMTTTGQLSFGNNSTCLDVDGKPALTALSGHDFGYVAYVDNIGKFHVAAALDDKPKVAEVVKSFPAPEGLTEGKYFFQLEKNTNGTSVGIYKEGATERQYTLFLKPQITRGWESSSGKVKLGLDGNLIVHEGDTFLWGSYQNLSGLMLSEICFGTKGQMTWLDGSGTVIKKFPCTTGTGPFTLAVSAVDKQLVVLDANKETLYNVFSKVKRGWESSSGGNTVRFGSDGNLMVFEGTTFLGGSYQNLDKLMPAGICFDTKGQMTWLDDSGAAIKTFPCTTGTGPFTLAVSAIDKQLVVVDANNKTLYTVFDYKSTKTA